ncbi:MAG TPA: phosphoenolpyruvate--protein phosphotransferase [Bacteroidota bacterium]|nr:phosphoenolpyruvate--protein phosphotransferase [Bacteroidota bacterium]
MKIKEETLETKAPPEVRRPGEEIVLRGIPASPGIAIGAVFIARKHQPHVFERILEAADVEKEIDRLRSAVARSMKEMKKILDFAEHKLGEKQAKIFEAQLMILEDAVLFEAVYKRIRKELKNSEYVVQDEIEKYHRVMLASKDEYARERAGDLEDVRNRILRNLDEQKLVSKFEGPHIVVSHILGAADTMILSRNEVLAYATEAGGATSHMALLARALKIPAVVGIPTVASAAQEEGRIVVDGFNGVIVVNPSPQAVRRYEEKKEEYSEFERRLSSLRDLPAETLDGHRVRLTANIELEQELEFLRVQGADGIGLYRSETLLIGREVFPSEEEQFRVYHTLAEGVYPKSIVIRTFDVGGDKMMMHSVTEKNPFLGWRGIRVMLDKPRIFLDQLRAILRASMRKNVSIMFPMISNIKEVRLAKQLLQEAKDQLRAKKIPFHDELPIGAMIEVPAAAVIADHLARELQFLSIGTNDLIQYLLAVDRTNDIVSEHYQEFHPAVLRFLRRIIERGKLGKAHVGMCGAMAGDPQATMLLLGLGLEEFSVVPAALPEIKKIIRSVHFTEATHLAEKVLKMETEDQIQTYLRKIMKQKFPDIPLAPETRSE